MDEPTQIDIETACYRADKAFQQRRWPQFFYHIAEFYRAAAGLGSAEPIVILAPKKIVEFNRSLTYMARRFHVELMPWFSDEDGEHIVVGQSLVEILYWVDEWSWQTSQVTLVGVDGGNK